MKWIDSTSTERSGIMQDGKSSINFNDSVVSASFIVIVLVYKDIMVLEVVG